MVEGIVLAGGYSSRANVNKMMLYYQDKPLIMHAIETMHKVCSKIIVVTGYYHDEVYDFLKKYPYIDIVYNENYNLGMFSSICKGVEKAKTDFIIVPGDYPNISKETYEKIVTGIGDIRVPSFKHRLGHPIFFSKEYKEKILTTESTNLKDFRNQFQYTIIDVDDPGVMQDIDSLEDYENLIKKGLI